VLRRKGTPARTIHSLIYKTRESGEEVPSFSDGMFTGERSILAGGRFLARIVARTATTKKAASSPRKNQAHRRLSR
jgi:hypothetical protein